MTLFDDFWTSTILLYMVIARKSSILDSSSAELSVSSAGGGRREAPEGKDTELEMNAKAVFRYKLSYLLGGLLHE